MARINTKALADAFIAEQVAEIRAQVGEKKVLLALSVSSGKSKLAALLGDDVERSADFKINVEQGDEKVCRNCRHLAVHPFKNVCLLSQLEVDTMSDCDKFELKKRGDK